MGRSKNFEFKKYVSYDKNNNISTCLLCERNLKGRLVGNIKRHYKRIHKINLDTEKGRKETTETSISHIVHPKRKGNLISINLNKNDFLRCCVGLVTIKNMPLRIFDDEEYFKKILRPYEEHFEISIDSEGVLDKVQLVSNKVEATISKALENKIISLKVDVVTRMGKSVLGIHIQYIKDSKIHINTLGIIQLKRIYTAQSLKDKIINCLCGFNINVMQLYSVTIYNGTNVKRTSRLLEELQNEIQIDDENFCQSDVNDERLEIHSRCTSVLTAVRCAAHTIQLTAQDVLNALQTQVDECRKFVKALRVIICSENQWNLQMPKIDNVNRWNSTYDMLSSLLDLRYHIENSFVEFNMPDVDWNFIERFLDAFRPLSEYANKFQGEQYIIGDFYRDWMCCEIELEEKQQAKNIYAAQLLEAMKLRKEDLLKNKAFISAIYLDPRFNFKNTPFLIEEHRTVALEHLLKVNELIIRLSDGSLSQTNKFDKSETYVCPPTEETSAFAKLEAKANCLRTQSPTTSTETTKQKLERLCSSDRIPFDANILEYWKNKNYSDPELGKLIDVALGVPCTQASVDRAISAVSTILAKTKAKLSEDVISNMLLIKLNSNVLNEISIEEDV